MYKKIIKEIFQSGGQAYICGGFVRDMILERKSKDIDIEVFNIDLKEFEKILSKFGNWKKAGKEFEVYIFQNRFEFSFPRDENGKENPEILIEESAKRRDFTMNSLYYDIINDKILDYCSGLADINAGIIRETSERNLLADPIRMLRAIQFMARFDFELETKTKETIINNFYLIKKCQKERVSLEIEKILLKAKKPSKAFYFLKENNLLQYIFPELEILTEIMQDKIYHPEGDVFTHTMMCLDVLQPAERELDIMHALLWHDLGKAHCEVIKSGEMILFKSHGEVSAEKTGENFKRFSNNKQLLKKINNLIYFHQAPLDLFLSNKINRIEIKKLAVKTDLPKLLKVYRADVLGRGRIDNSDELAAIAKIQTIYEQIKDELEPIIKGKDLIECGIQPGVELGELLAEIYLAQLEEKFTDQKSGLEFFKEKIKNKTYK